jgi:hypothetical protein
MKRLVISAAAAIVVLAAATSMLRSHSSSTGPTSGMMSLHELHKATDVNKLPIDDTDDQSLVFSRTKR